VSTKAGQLHSSGIAVVVGIYIAPRASVTSESVSEAVVEEGRGIVGDRYHSGDGTFSKPKPDRHMTLIEAEEIDHFNAEQGFSFGYGDFRRNLVTRGVRLNDLVGQTFHVGGVTLEGIRTCEPCQHLGQLLTTEVVPHLANRAGLRARVVVGGRVAVGDAVGRRTGKPGGGFQR